MTIIESIIHTKSQNRNIEISTYYSLTTSTKSRGIKRHNYERYMLVNVFCLPSYNNLKKFKRKASGLLWFLKHILLLFFIFILSNWLFFLIGLLVNPGKWLVDDCLLFSLQLYNSFAFLVGLKHTFCTQICSFLKHRSRLVKLCIVVKLTVPASGVWKLMQIWTKVYTKHQDLRVSTLFNLKEIINNLK